MHRVATRFVVRHQAVDLVKRDYITVARCPVIVVLGHVQDDTIEESIADQRSDAATHVHANANEKVVEVSKKVDVAIAVAIGVFIAVGVEIDIAV